MYLRDIQPGQHIINTETGDIYECTGQDYLTGPMFDSHNGLGHGMFWYELIHKAAALSLEKHPTFRLLVEGENIDY